MGYTAWGFWHPPPVLTLLENSFFFNSLIHSKVSGAPDPFGKYNYSLPPPPKFFFIRGMVINDNICIQYFEHYISIILLILLHIASWMTKQIIFNNIVFVDFFFCHTKPIKKPNVIAIHHLLHVKQDRIIFETIQRNVTCNHEISDSYQTGKTEQTSLYFQFKISTVA